MKSESDLSGRDTAISNDCSALAGYMLFDQPEWSARSDSRFEVELGPSLVATNWARSGPIERNTAASLPPRSVRTHTLCSRSLSNEEVRSVARSPADATTSRRRGGKFRADAVVVISNWHVLVSEPHTLRRPGSGMELLRQLFLRSAGNL